MATVFFRCIILYFVLIAAIRFSGKRQIGELQPSELVLAILISNIAVVPIEEPGTPLISGIIPIVILVCIEVIISFLSSRFPVIDQLFSGKPRIIAEGGKLRQKALKQLRISPSDYAEQMRLNQICGVTDTVLAVMETSGKISFFKKDPKLSMPQIPIIENGKIAKHFMKYCGVDENWIYKTLQKEKAALSDIYMMTCSKNKQYTIMRKES